MTSYRDWLAVKKQEAEDRGGKRLANLPGASFDNFRGAGVQAEAVNRGFAIPRSTKRKRGEIINPLTGEIVSDCLTIGKLAKSMGMTTQRLTDAMVELAMVQRVLDFELVPMFCDPVRRKARYFHRPEATRFAVECGLAIPVKHRCKGTVKEFVVVTPRGQAVASEATAPQEPNAKRADVRRAEIERLHLEGKPAAEIVRLTDIPRRTVYHHLKAIKEAA